MSTVFYYIIPFIVVLGILIFFHELGHFLLSKLFKVKVLKFSLGFGPKIIGKTVGETEYVISAFPLGGYVKLLGENDDEEIAPEDAPRAFPSQPVLHRMAIAAAGPVFNFILAFLLFSGIYLVSGYTSIAPEVGHVRPESPADNAGIRKGDVIEYIEGTKIERWSQMKQFVEKNPEQGLNMVVAREARRFSTTVFPKEEVVKNLFGEEVKSALIGIVTSGKTEQIRLGLFSAIKEGAVKTWEITSLTFLVLIKLFQGVVPLKTVGGPIMIGQMAGEIARENFSYLIPFMAVISVNLAILNLLPVPVLDGGMILFFLVEIVTRKPISIKKREMAQKIGFFVLLMLMALVFYNDLLRILTK